MKLFSRKKKHLRLHKHLPKIEFSGSSIIITLAVAGVTYFVGNKVLGKHLAQAPALSSWARAYATDTDLNTVHRRILLALYKHAENKQQVITNMDRILAAITSFDEQLKALITERASGQITPQMYRMKLREVIKTLATQMGISLRAAPHHVVKGPWKAMQNMDKWKQMFPAGFPPGMMNMPPNTNRFGWWNTPATGTTSTNTDPLAGGTI